MEPGKINNHFTLKDILQSSFFYKIKTVETLGLFFFLHVSFNVIKIETKLFYFSSLISYKLEMAIRN